MSLDWGPRGGLEVFHDGSNSPRESIEREQGACQESCQSTFDRPLGLCESQTTTTGGLR